MSIVRSVAGRSFLYGTLAVVMVAALGPTTWIALSSFKERSQVLSGTGVLPQPWTLQGYRAVFEEVSLEKYMFNTLLYAGTATLTATAVALLAAYPCARLTFPLRRTLTTVFSLGMAVPLVGLIVPEYFIAVELGLYDTKFGLILFYTAIFFPLCFVILRAFLVNLPYEIEEAARVDGAGYGTILWKIIVPIARPGLATVAVLVFIGIWNDFLWALLLAPGFENQNIQVVLAGFKSQFVFNVTAALAGASVAVVVPIIAFLVMQRHVIAGLTSGASR